MTLESEEMKIPKQAYTNKLSELAVKLDGMANVCRQ